MKKLWQWLKCRIGFHGQVEFVDISYAVFTCPHCEREWVEELAELFPERRR